MPVFVLLERTDDFHGGDSVTVVGVFYSLEKAIETLRENIPPEFEIDKEYVLVNDPVLFSYACPSSEYRLEVLESEIE